MRRSSLLLTSVFLALVCTPQLAFAQALNQNQVNTKAKAEKKDNGFPLHMSASLSQSVGSGTFILDRYSDNPFLLTSLSLNPSARFGGWSVALSHTITFEETQPDNPTGRRVDMFDPRVTVGHSVLALKALGVNIGARGGLAIPISIASRQAGTVLAPLLSGNISYSAPFLSGLNLSAGVSGRYHLISRRLAGRDQAPGKELGQTQTSPIQISNTCLTRPGESVADACVGASTVFLLSENLSASYSVGDWSLSASLALIHPINNYWAGKDSLASENANGSLLPTNLSNGSLTVSYQALKWLSLSAGTSSFQRVLRSRAGSYLNPLNYRFPFWDFEGAAANRSSVFTSVTASF